jgi:hypothetical protein
MHIANLRPKRLDAMSSGKVTLKNGSRFHLHYFFEGCKDTAARDFSARPSNLATVRALI